MITSVKVFIGHAQKRTIHFCSYWPELSHMAIHVRHVQDVVQLCAHEEQGNRVLVTPAVHKTEISQKSKFHETIPVLTKQEKL